MKKFLCGVCVLAISASFTSCDTSNPFKEEVITAELGEIFVLPDIGENYDAVVTDESGAIVRVQYGSFMLSKAGTYTVTATVSGKEYQIQVVCRDTIAPTVQFDKHLIDVKTGETVSIPLFSVNDKAGIATQTIKVTDDDGEEVTVTDNTFVAANGNYCITATATDNNGNSAVDKVEVIVHKEFYDTTLGSGELASFSSSDYLSLIYQVDGVDCFSPSVHDGALELSTDKEYGEVYSTMVIPVKDFNFSKTGSVTVRLKVDKPTDFVQIRGTKNEIIAGAEYYLDAETWYDIDVDPVLLGYGVADSFTVVSRSMEGLKVTIDKVTYSENKLDENYAGIEDFSGETPLARVFQNTYSSRYFLGTDTAIGGGGGSSFSIADKYFYGQEKPIKVLRVETVERGGGFTYLFQNVEDIENIESISITLSQEKAMNFYDIGVLHDEYKVSAFTQRVSAGGINERMTFTIYTNSVGAFEGFSNKCETKITGIWLGTVDYKNAGNVLNVESIQINYKK